jgi:CHAT domain-containing protein
LATHGFFLSDRQIARLGGEGLWPLGRQGESGSLEVSSGFNPLVRSGLALAGANRAVGGDAGDGLLTAEKVLGLSLAGTRLVVLSACDTGVGEIQNGEGVYGLRRAFLQAGAQSLVTSLWPVPDVETRELMVRFYSLMQEGGIDRAQALRQAALDEMDVVRQKYGQAHPLLWGAFIFVGDPGKNVRQ